jgi:hypothetical protein
LENILVRVLERNKTNRVYIERKKQSYYKRLTDTIVEAEKSHNVQTSSWRLKKTGGIFPVKTQSLRTKGVNGVKFQSVSQGPRTQCADFLRQGKMEGPVEEESKLAFLPAFCSI